MAYRQYWLQCVFDDCCSTLLNENCLGCFAWGRQKRIKVVGSETSRGSFSSILDVLYSENHRVAFLASHEAGVVSPVKCNSGQESLFAQENAYLIQTGVRRVLKSASE